MAVESACLLKLVRQLSNLSCLIFLAIKRSHYDLNDICFSGEPAGFALLREVERILSWEPTQDLLRPEKLVSDQYQWRGSVVKRKYWSASQLWSAQWAPAGATVSAVGSRAWSPDYTACNNRIVSARPGAATRRELAGDCGVSHRWCRDFTVCRAAVSGTCDGDAVTITLQSRRWHRKLIKTSAALQSIKISVTLPECGPVCGDTATHIRSVPLQQEGWSIIETAWK